MVSASKLARHDAEYQFLKQFKDDFYIVDTMHKEYYLAQPPSFNLPLDTIEKLKSKPEPFSVMGKAIYRRTYSRAQLNGKKEEWWQSVQRVIEGLFSWLAEHHRKNFLKFNVREQQKIASQMAIDMFDLKWSPPGRGLWAMGTEHVRRCGSAALNNCYATSTANLQEAASWMMSQLMRGGGVGFSCDNEQIILRPFKSKSKLFVIPDCQEGWCAALEMLIAAYIINPRTGKRGPFPKFDYSEIRGPGSLIEDFGGTSQGSEPLRIMLERIEIFFDTYLDELNYDKTSNNERPILVMMRRLYQAGIYEIDGEGNRMTSERYEQLRKQVEAKIDQKYYGRVRLIVDIMNSIGCCVVAGNVRRSALIAVADAHQNEFYKLKDYDLNPERGFIAWMSNNSIRLSSDEDFKIYLPIITEQANINGELPGLINLKNSQRFGRTNHGFEVDTGIIPNPCGEIILPDKGPCCLSVVFPNRCCDLDEWERVSKHALRYAKIVTTIPHPWQQTNLIIQRERRLGVSQTGLAIRYDKDPIKFRTEMSYIYKCIKQEDERVSAQWGIPKSIRVTALKPEGTVSKLVDETAGLHFPTSNYMLRRIRYAKDHPDLELFEQAGLPIAVDPKTANTKVVTFPVKYPSSVRPVHEVDFYEQLALASMCQETYADNSVSSTSYFTSKYTGETFAHAVAVFLPMVKSLSFMPYFDTSANAELFPLAPEQPITKQVYDDFIADIKPIEWNQSTDIDDSSAPRGCTSDVCLRETV